MENKVGIITFHRAYNYGALLQAYALQTIVKELIDNVEIIDFKNYVNVKQKISFKRKLILFIRDILYIDRTIGYKKRKKKMNNFISCHYNLSRPYNLSNIKESNKEYDCFIVGSDQVWNMSFENNDVYLLNFVEDGHKKISYAASFGYSRIPEQFIEMSKNGIKKFQYIGVREKSGIDIVHEQLNLTAALNADPTLLLSKVEWKKRLINDEPLIKEKYLVAYFVATQTNAMEFAINYANKHSLKLVIIYDKTQSKIRGALNVYNAGVEEFLNYLYYADTIVTTSFHGLSFAINFNKNFYYELNQDKLHNANDRLITLINLLNLKNCEITSANMEESSPIDWDACNKKLDQIRKNSVEFLAEAIK